MERIPEPELMLDTAQAEAYAAADFAEPHSRVVDLFREWFPAYAGRGHVLDLGCGPGDVTCRFAQAYPESTLHGLDGSAAMIACGRARLAREPAAVQARVTLLEGVLPQTPPPRAGYDVILSNSLLHHLANPMVCWETIRRFAMPGTLVFVVDLRRAETPAHAHALVQKYSGSEPEILKRDFYHSLLAAFTENEVRSQLQAARLEYLRVEAISDRHLAVGGVYH